MLAMMARRFLTIPASSVSSESTFSTGRSVLDDYRSSLKPVTVEALVCGANYIKGAHRDLNVIVCFSSPSHIVNYLVSLSYNVKCMANFLIFRRRMRRKMWRPSC